MKSTGDWQLARTTSGDAVEIVVTQLEVANTYLSRFAGLQLRRELPAGRGLLLVPCPSIHTMWMRFAIDAVMIDAHGRVVEIRQGIRPWRIVVPREKTHAILELPADSCTLTIGDELSVQSSSAAPPPRSLEFLSATRHPAETPKLCTLTAR